MPRFKLIIEYNGGPFAGWQRQAQARTVQGAIEAALTHLDPAGPLVQGAGRTDAGVHATGQVAHVDLVRDWDPFRLAEALNHHLRPDPVAILAAEAVGADFHARFSALRRHYTYRIACRRAPLTLRAGLAWRIGHRLDVPAMQQAAAALVGHHDFTTFRSAHCQAASPVKTLDRLDITVEPAADGRADVQGDSRVDGREDILFRLDARSFLHNQVRSLVGTLERVGAGKWHPGDVAEALAARDRAACGPVAPADGLYLTGVDYPA